MFAYLVSRIILFIPSVLALFSIIFIFIRLAPGDPAEVMMGQYATEEVLKVVREEMGLNAPLWMQYLQFLGNLMRGDLGVSMSNGFPVVQQLRYALPYTLMLTFAALIIGVVCGIPLGIYTALHRNRIVDYVGRIFSLAGISIPSFYLAILLIYLFSVRIRLFPVVGGGDLDDIISLLRHLFLPALTMGLMLTAYLGRITRSTMLNSLNEDYVRTARAKGVKEKIVIYKHALGNSLIPVIAVLGIYVIILLGASVMVEIVFSRPGLGKLMVMAMQKRDYVMLQSVMIIFALLAMVVNLLVDLCYGLIDPRIKYKK